MAQRHSGDPTPRIVDALPALTRLLAAEVRKAGAEAQLTMPQFSVLRLLSERTYCVGELARTMHVSMPTVTQSVDGLVGKGLAERHPDEQDRRQVRVGVTTAGRSVLKRCRSDLETYWEAALASWPSQRRQDVASALEELLASAEEARTAREG